MNIPDQHMQNVAENRVVKKFAIYDYISPHQLFIILTNIIKIVYLIFLCISSSLLQSLKRSYLGITDICHVCHEVIHMFHMCAREA